MNTEVLNGISMNGIAGGLKEEVKPYWIDLIWLSGIRAMEPWHSVSPTTECLLYK